MKLKLIFSLLMLLCVSGVSGQTIDTLEFQPGYPNKHTTALEQLQSFPSPRYQPGNSFIRIFNWMNPKFMAGGGQPGMKDLTVNLESGRIQEELALNWNYFITIPNSGMAASKETAFKPNQPLKIYVDLANAHPEIPLAVTTFWLQLRPQLMGYKTKTPNILKKDFPNKLYIKDASGAVVKNVLNFAAPDSLFVQDGKYQKILLQNLLSQLTRPIDFISENGEESPAAHHISLISDDADMIADKKKLRIDDWKIYASVKKTHMRKLYSDQFMKLPELKNTVFSIYSVEGGPVYRFDWETSKISCSKIKGNYYSTPDFYPRYPDNWKIWKGAWHGWKWISKGRTVEINSGDKFFSPFVAAGWSRNPEYDMRPGQWLGLLKCLSVVGAEFFYAGYFNEKKPFSKPENYVWQAAMPSYAQAVSTYYSDVFFNGNVLFDEQKKPIITYPVNADDVLAVVRKHDQKEKYVIALTVQPFSNTERYPLQKSVEIDVAGDHLKLKARRQGSVYVYDKTVNPALLYQLDRWHQYEHPGRWRKEWIAEAEVVDTASESENSLIHSVYLTKSGQIDASMAESYIQLNALQWTEYSFSKRDADHLGNTMVIMIYAKCADQIRINTNILGSEYLITGKKSDNWEWIKFPFELKPGAKGPDTIKLTSLTNGVLIDKIIISNSTRLPDLGNY